MPSDLRYIPSAHQELGHEAFFMRRVTDDGAFVLTGELSYIIITNGGSGYTSAPTITIGGVTSGGGTGATAVAKVLNGKVVLVIISNAGSGYTSAPDVAFSGGAGTGASATATIKDKWQLGFGRLKSEVEYGQPETEVFGEGGNLFNTKKENKTGKITFTSLQDDAGTEEFLTKEVGKYKWAIFQVCGIDQDNETLGLTFWKYRYMGIVRIPNYYKVSAQGREPDMSGFILDNKSAITVDESALPIAGLLQAYDLLAHELCATKSEPIAPSI